MPKGQTNQLDLPPGWAELWPKAHVPVRTAANRLTFTSPYDEYPGTIATKMRLTAADYDKYWRLAKDGVPPEWEDHHWAHYQLKTGFHIITDWKLDNVETTSVTEDGLLLPDMRLVVWAAHVIQPILAQATYIPNW